MQCNIAISESTVGSVPLCIVVKQVPVTCVTQGAIPLFFITSKKRNKSDSCPLSYFPTFRIYMVGSSDTSFL